MSCHRSEPRKKANQSLKESCPLSIAVHSCLPTSRRGAVDRTVQPLGTCSKLKKMIRSAKSIECKSKIFRIPINPSEVHEGTTHAKVEGEASQQTHLILVVHKNVTDQTVPVSVLRWKHQEEPVRGAQQFGGRDQQYGNVHGTAEVHENTVEPDDDCRVQFDNYGRDSQGRPSRREVDRRTVPDCRLSHQARIEDVGRCIATSNRSDAVADHRRGHNVGNTMGGERHANTRVSRTTRFPSA